MDPGIRFSQIKDVFDWILGRWEEEAIKRSETERERWAPYRSLSLAAEYLVEATTDRWMKGKMTGEQTRRLCCWNPALLPGGGWRGKTERGINGDAANGKRRCDMQSKLHTNKMEYMRCYARKSLSISQVEAGIDELHYKVEAQNVPWKYNLFPHHPCIRIFHVHLNRLATYLARVAIFYW